MTSEVDLAKQDSATSQSLLQKQLDRSRDEKDLLQNRVNQLMDVQHKSMKAKLKAQGERDSVEERLLASYRYIHDLKESYQKELSNARQELQKSVDELKCKRERMFQNQEITKTWNIEYG